MNLIVDGREFTEKGLKFRGWRRGCFAAALLAVLLMGIADYFTSLTHGPS
jgi:hypothetical protein